jgi:hypothetical protein
LPKGRLELWLGTGCALLILAAGLGGYYHKHLQAAWYRWRFLHGDKARCDENLAALERLGPAGRVQLSRLVVESPAELEYSARPFKSDVTEIRVRNNRGHRVCLKPIPGTDSKSVAAAPAWLNQHQEPCDPAKLSSVPLARAKKPSSLTLAALQSFVPPPPDSVVLDPGQEALFWTWPGYVPPTPRPRPAPSEGVVVTVPIQSSSRSLSESLSRSSTDDKDPDNDRDND